MLVVDEAVVMFCVCRMYWKVGVIEELLLVPEDEAEITAFSWTLTSEGEAMPED